MNYDAIQNINPSVVTVRGDVAYDKDEKVVSINQDDYEAEITRLQAEHDAEQIQAEADKASAVSKLEALGLTDAEIKALSGGL
jgi:regulator of protease activity HflC (stomatin/prohibitin superfamily)